MTRFSPVRFVRAASCTAWAVLLATGASAQGSDAPHAVGRSKPIPDRYVVVFKKDVANPGAEADEAVRKAGGRRHQAFSRAIKGFSATLSADAVQRLRADPSVDYIEQDQTVSIAGTQSPATWGLDRVDQRDRPLDTLYNYNYTGAGVNAFIIDTGIRSTHSEFTGRMLAGFTAVSDGNGTNDCNGHGTHVAGTVGGSTWGVARGVSLIPVRVLDCQGSGSISGVIAGIEFVANSALRPAVANMSLGGGFSAALNTAVANAVADGVAMVVAAGNDGRNACNYSPASEPSAITVGATSSSDARASFSNFGKCVDVFAPGVSITSSWSTNDGATNSISGTSMATPHVAGVAALALEANPAASPLAVTSFVVANATPNRLSSIGSGSPNLLLFSLATGVPTEPAVPSIAVSQLSGQPSNTRPRRDWRALATITVRNVNTSAVIANATVNGSFAPGGSGYCVTDSLGRCTITSANMSGTIPSTVFTVGNVAGNGMAYDSTQNSASQIVILHR